MTTQSEKQSWGQTLFLGLVQLLSVPMVLGGILVIYELTAPEDRSIWVAIQERLAQGVVKEIEVAAPSEAWKEQLFQVAAAEIERVNQAYQSLWQANSQIMVIAYQMEDKVLQSQIKAIEESYGAAKFTANMGELGCALGGILGDYTLQSGCGYAQNQREKMAQEIKDITERNRSNIPKNIINGLPKPEDLKIDKQRLEDLMKGFQDEQ